MPEERLTPWGERVNILSCMSDEQLDGFCSDWVEETFRLVNKHRDILWKSEHFGKVRERLIADAEATATDADGEVDDAKKTKELLRSVEEYWQVKFTKVLIENISKSWRSKSKAVKAGGVRSNKIPDNVITFQNGFFEAESGRFIPSLTAWRESEHTIFASFNGEIESAFRGLVNGSSRVSSRLLRSFLKEHAPHFLTFMESAFPDDPDNWVILLRVIGYCFLPGNPFDVMFSFFGESGAGKGTTWGIIRSLIDGGEGRLTYALNMRGAAEMRGGFINAVGKLAVNIDEAESSDKKIHENVFTALKNIVASSSGAKVHVDEKYIKGHQAYIGAKMVLTANKPILYTDDTGALERRMVTVNFSRVPNIQNEKLLPDLLNSEACALATLGALFVHRGWEQKKGMFEGSKATDEGKIEFVHATNPVKAFLMQLLTITGNRAHSVTTSFLLSALRLYVDKVEGVQERQQIEDFLNGNSKVVGKRIIGVLSRLGIDSKDVRRGKVKDMEGNWQHVITVFGVQVSKPFVEEIGLFGKL